MSTEQDDWSPDSEDPQPSADQSPTEDNKELNETPAPQPPGDEQRITELQTELDSLKWEKEYTSAFSDSGLPDSSTELVRELLDGATTEQVAPTIAKLAAFAESVRPAPAPSQRPVDSMKSGVPPKNASGIYNWRDALR